MSPVLLESLPGSVLDQKYRIERQLGKGAMGAVFQATHLGTTRPVALKVIVPQLAGHQEFAMRFKREAEATGRLNHPNVVNVTDFGVTRVGESDLAYLVMEYLDGQALSDYLDKNQRPTFNFLLDIMDQAGLALDAAHAAGIVHRDLKPSNIWLEPNHRGGYNVKVLDFGIAKVTGPSLESRANAASAVETMLMAPSQADSTLAFAMAEAANPMTTPSSLRTTVGTLLGTPSFMAPEQCAGIEVDARADVYSLAVIAYQMLCGRLPFEAETLPQLIKQQIQTVPQSPREHDATVPEALAAVVLSGLEKDPGRRPPTAGTFAARLRAASEAELGLLRKSKDKFHTYPSTFLPMLLACMVVMLAGTVPIKLAAGWAARAKVLPEGALFALMLCGSVLMTLFAFQLFKAAGMRMLLHGSETGQFRSARGAALRSLVGGMGALIGTQLLSMVDLRPSAFWANILWPVVWAAEGRSGKDAIARSRQLCGTLPTASANLTLRQYGPALLGSLIFPALMSLDPTGAGLLFVERKMLSGSVFGSIIFFLYPVLFGIMFVNWALAFSFLYWSALRCRNEGSEISLPAAARDDSRKAASAIRPATLMWMVLPVIMVAIIVVRANVSAPSVEMDEASGDGRRTALLKLIDGGLGVEQPTSSDETALFDAVRGGDGKLVAELLQRGAKVNVRNRAGGTPLMQAAIWGRNELARVLLDHGASADSANQDRRTALMMAAMRGNADLVKVLLERGANPGLMDSKGKTAGVYAAEEGYGELVGLLKR